MPLLGGIINGDQSLKAIYNGIRANSKLCFVIKAFLSTPSDTSVLYLPAYSLCG